MKLKKSTSYEQRPLINDFHTFLSTLCLIIYQDIKQCFLPALFIVNSRLLEFEIRSSTFARVQTLIKEKLSILICLHTLIEKYIFK